MEQTKAQRIKVSMNHGLVIGLILIAYAFLVSITDPGAGSLLTLLHWAVMIAAVFYSIKTWRDNYNGGFISYGQALGFGFRTMFFASVSYGFDSMIYMTWINPDSVNEALTAVEEGYFQLGFTDEQIEQYMEMAQKMQTPGWQMFTTILGTTFSGFIISLIVSLFVKKDDDPFRSAMSGVTEEDTVDNL